VLASSQPAAKHAHIRACQTLYMTHPSLHPFPPTASPYLCDTVQACVQSGEARGDAPTGLTRRHRGQRNPALLLLLLLLVCHHLLRLDEVPGELQQQLQGSSTRQAPQPTTRQTAGLLLLLWCARAGGAAAGPHKGCLATAAAAAARLPRCGAIAVRAAGVRSLLLLLLLLLPELLHALAAHVPLAPAAAG
jgi:hypothetical protein